MKITWIAAGLLILPGHSLAQDLGKKITIDIPAMRAQAALAELGKAAGLTLEPAANLRDDVLVVSVRDVPVQEVLDRIAQAEKGRWQLQSGIYLLSRDQAVTAEQERAELKDRASLVSAAIAKLGESLKGQAQFNEGDAQKLADDTKKILDQATQPGSGPRTPDLRGMLERTPAARAVARLLASIDPSQLARIAPHQRIVLSTHPTRMQVGLGGAGVRIFNDFVREQQLYARSFNNLQGGPDDSRRVMINGLGTPTLGNGKPELGLGVGLVIVQRRFGSSLDVQILAADPNLDMLASGNQMLQIVPTDSPRSTTQIASSNEKLSLSAHALELAKALGGGQSSGGVLGRPTMVRAFSSSSGGNFVVTSMEPSTPVQLSAGLREKVLNPEKFDPMSFAPGEAMLALAKATGKNVVALLPDPAFSTINRQAANEVTIGQFVNALSSQHGMAMDQSEAWLVLNPMQPVLARTSAVNRSALGSLLRKIDRAGMGRLDDIAAFALQQAKVPGVTDIDGSYVRLIDAGVAERDIPQMASGSYPLYRLYGSLTPAQRQAFANGGTLPFSNLNGVQLGYVADLVYHSMQGPSVQLPDQGGTQQTRSIEQTVVLQGGAGIPMMPMMVGGGNQVRTERTIALPNGITRDGMLTGSITAQDAVQATNSETGAMSILDLTSLAFSRANLEQPAGSSFTPPKFDRYRLMQQTSIQMRFLFSPEISLARSLTDTSPVPGAQPVAYDSLPLAFRQKVERTAAEIKANFGQIRGGQRMTSPPPPGP